MKRIVIAFTMLASLGFFSAEALASGMICGAYYCSAAQNGFSCSNGSFCFEGHGYNGTLHCVGGEETFFCDPNPGGVGGYVCSNGWSCQSAGRSPIGEDNQ